MKNNDSNNNNISINLLNFIINININIYRSIYIEAGNYNENINGDYIENLQYRNSDNVSLKDSILEILPDLICPTSKSAHLIKTIYGDIIYQFNNSPLTCNFQR